MTSHCGLCFNPFFLLYHISFPRSRSLPDFALRFALPKRNPFTLTQSLHTEILQRQPKILLFSFTEDFHTVIGPLET